MWGLELLGLGFYDSLGLVSKFEPGLGLGDYGLDYIIGVWWPTPCRTHPVRAEHIQYG